MRKIISAALLACLLIGVAAVAAPAEKTHSFTLPADAKVNGTMLEAGKYKIRLNGGSEAEIMRRGKTVATISVRVEPRTGASQAGTVLIKNGEVAEIRLKEETIILT